MFQKMIGRIIDKINIWTVWPIHNERR
jgi:hypothetical protein